MRSILTLLAPSAFVLASLPAQSPEDGHRPAARPELTMVSLQSLTTAVVQQRQPLTNDTGTVAQQPFARIFDARFDRDGRLLSLLVEPPVATEGARPAPRELPAKLVEWDDTGKCWITTSTSIVFAELAEVPAPGAAAEAALKQQREQKPLAASGLMVATVGAKTTPATPAGDVRPATTARSSPVFWFVPAQKMLTFAVVELDGRNVPLPWPMLQIQGGPSLEVEVVARKDQLEAPPLCKTATDAPSFALRQECYRHFGIPAPKWDGAPQPMEKDGKAPQERSKDG